MFRWFSRKRPDQLRDRRYLGAISVLFIVIIITVFVLNPYIMAEREFGDVCENYSSGTESIRMCKSFCLGPCDNGKNSNVSRTDCFYMGEMESCMETCTTNSRTRCIMDLWASEHGFAYKE